MKKFALTGQNRQVLELIQCSHAINVLIALYVITTSQQGF